MTGSIVPQSAGSLSVAILALIMTILQAMFYFRQPRFAWYAWGAAASFSCMAYSVGIFLEYNTLGAINRAGGLLEFTAVVLLVYFLYGFTLAYFGMEAKRFHILAGISNCLILILLWSSDVIVADRFVSRRFLWMRSPFVESDLGYLGPFFELYVALMAVGAVLLWLRLTGPNPRHRTLYFTGIIFWLALGIHDGLASMGMPAFQYLMEYGFLGFSVIILWVVFDSFVDISAEDKYRTITEFANDGILVCQGGRLVFANEACRVLAGRPAIDLRTEDLLEAVVPEDRQKLIETCEGRLHSAESSDSFLVRMKRPEHEERVVEIRASAIVYRNSPAVLAVMRDVTERIRKEEALKESQEKLSRLRKMESLGLLAGGVAHDLNNVLAGIVGYPDLILLDLPQDSPLRKPIETMQESGNRAVAIVRDLLTVARGVAIQKEPFNLNDVIKGYLRSPECKKLLQFHPTVSVRDNLAPDLLNVKGSPVHVGKIVMNLVSNACEAIKGSGEVVVSTMNRYVDKPLKGYDQVDIGEYAVLVVEDNGPGISLDDLNRIFEPFYSKKVMGRSGTGLGLTLVWNVIQDHDGYIDVASGRGGTKFELYFPVTRDLIPDKKSLPAMENLYGCGERVLVIDDVDSQREILCHMLEALRYKPEAVSDGEEAIEYLRKHEVDLLLLDMIMDPGMNGRDTYEEIRKIRPRQKAIIVSGFAETHHVQETLKLGAGRFLKKPVNLEELGRAVKAELESSGELAL